MPPRNRRLVRGQGACVLVHKQGTSPRSAPDRRRPRESAGKSPTIRREDARRRWRHLAVGDGAGRVLRREPAGARAHTHTYTSRTGSKGRSGQGRSPRTGPFPSRRSPRKAARKRWRKGCGQRAVGSEASERGAGLTGCSCSGSLAPPPAAAAAAAKANPLNGTEEPGWMRGVKATVTVG